LEQKRTNGGFERFRVPYQLDLYIPDYICAWRPLWAHAPLIRCRNRHQHSVGVLVLPQASDIKIFHEALKAETSIWEG
jgi:hypothetical protein